MTPNGLLHRWQIRPTLRQIFSHGRGWIIVRHLMMFPWRRHHSLTLEIAWVIWAEYLWSVLCLSDCRRRKGGQNLFELLFIWPRIKVSLLHVPTPSYRPRLWFTCGNAQWAYSNGFVVWPVKICQFLQCGRDFITYFDARCEFAACCLVSLCFPSLCSAINTKS